VLKASEFLPGDCAAAAMRRELDAAVARAKAAVEHAHCNLNQAMRTLREAHATLEDAEHIRQLAQPVVQAPVRFDRPDREPAEILGVQSPGGAPRSRQR
jgi:hypothetical protein